MYKPSTVLFDRKLVLVALLSFPFTISTSISQASLNKSTYISGGTNCQNLKCFILKLNKFHKPHKKRICILLNSGAFFSAEDVYDAWFTTCFNALSHLFSVSIGKVLAMCVDKPGGQIWTRVKRCHYHRNRTEKFSKILRIQGTVLVLSLLPRY